MSILTLLKEDHKTIKSLLGDLMKSKKKSRQFHELHELVHAHSKAEEIAFYEPLKKNKTARPLAFEGYEEHHIAGTLLKELERLDSDDDRWAAKLTVLDEALQHHIEEEESEMFTEAKLAFSAEELGEAGEQFKLRKEEFTGDSLPGSKTGRTEKSSAVSKIGKLQSEVTSCLTSSSGKIGYVIAWLLGIPVSLLFIVYLIRGH